MARNEPGDILGLRRLHGEPRLHRRRRQVDVGRSADVLCLARQYRRLLGPPGEISGLFDAVGLDFGGCGVG